MTWPRTSRPARRPLSQDLIVDTALALLGKGDLESVSMRRVAQELGTGAASLYAHVAGKAELNELMLDRLLGTIPVPAPDPQRWREQLKEVAFAQLDMLTSHPGIARAWPWRPPCRRARTRCGTEKACSPCCARAALADRVAALAFDTLALWCAAFAVEVSAVRAGEIDPAKVAHRGEQIGAYMSQRAAEFPNLLTLGPTLSSTPPEERFEFGLDVFLAGLAAR